MRTLFDNDGKLMRFLNMFTDILYLSILWIVCSIPIITVGASTAAYYSVMMKLVSGEESYIGRGFFKAFKENFKVATIVWIIMGLIGAFVAFSIYIVYVAGAMGSNLFYMLPFYFITLLIYLMTYNFVFPYIAKFYDTAGRCLYISLIYSTRYIGYSIMLIVVDGAVIFFAFQLPLLFILYPIISGFCHGKVYRHIFDKVIEGMTENVEENYENMENE